MGDSDGDGWCEWDYKINDWHYKIYENIKE
jgi:hypothetical protein